MVDPTIEELQTIIGTVNSIGSKMSLLVEKAQRLANADNGLGWGEQTIIVPEDNRAVEREGYEVLRTEVISLANGLFTTGGQ